MTGARHTELKAPLAWPAADWLIDRPALWGIAKLYFPLSRLWAAADVSGADLDRFFQDDDFYYLSGVEIPDIALALHVDASGRLADEVQDLRRMADAAHGRLLDVRGAGKQNHERRESRRRVLHQGSDCTLF